MKKNEKFNVGDFVKVRNPRDGLDFYGIVVKIAVRVSVTRSCLKVLRANSPESIQRVLWYKPSDIRVLARSQ